MVNMKTKKCFKCMEEKPLIDFYKHPEMPDGHVNKCKDCNKKDVQDNYSRNREYFIKYDKKRYRFSIKRMMKQKYQGIKNRCGGNGSHNYTVSGKGFLTWESFQKWWKENEDKYKELHAA